MKKAKIVYIDMDDTIADFYGATRNFKGEVREYMMWDKDFFLNLKPIPGCQGAVFDIQKMGYDVYILTQPLAEGPASYTDKALWIQRYFPTLYKKIVMTQNKGLNIGDYLIDDNKDKWQEKFEANGGKFIHYPYDYRTREKMDSNDHESRWRTIVEILRLELEQHKCS